MAIRIMAGKTVLTAFERGEGGQWNEKGVTPSADHRRHVERINEMIEAGTTHPGQTMGGREHLLGPRFQVHLVNDQPSGILVFPGTDFDGRDDLYRQMLNLPADTPVVHRFSYVFPGFHVRHEHLAPVLDRLEAASVNRVNLDTLREAVRRLKGSGC